MTFKERFENLKMRLIGANSINDHWTIIFPKKSLTTNNSIANINNIKGDEMSKQSDVKPDYKQEEIPVYTDTALGVFRAAKGGWYLAKIRYNPETGEVGSVEKTFAGDEKALGTERFKIAAVNEKLIF